MLGTLKQTYNRSCQPGREICRWACDPQLPPGPQPGGLQGVQIDHHVLEGVGSFPQPGSLLSLKYYKISTCFVFNVIYYIFDIVGEIRQPRIRGLLSWHEPQHHLHQHLCQVENDNT